LQGILIRDAAALEAAARVDCILFDKTGTLTTGTPVVTGIVAVASENASADGGVEDAERVLRFAASAEQYSQHPLARAIVAKARESGQSLSAPTEFANHPGLGVAATIEGRIVRGGGAAFLRANGIDLSPVEEPIRRFSADGQTVVLLAVDDACVGAISLSDQVRPEAASTVEALSRLGVASAVVSGDHTQTVAAIARAAGIPSFLAEQTPEGKLVEVRARQRAGQRVAFVGDGINDAPALAAADVGITLASATDVAIGAADITLVHDDLSRLVTVVMLARRSVRIIRQNLFWAFFYNLAALPLAATGLVPPGLAAAAMMLSSISVVLNSLRLRRVT
jgi:Cu+-exporting ATPase